MKRLLLVALLALVCSSCRNKGEVRGARGDLYYDSGLRVYVLVPLTDSDAYALDRMNGYVVEVTR